MQDKWAIRRKSVNIFTKFAFGLFRYVLLIGTCFVILYPLITKISIMFMSPEDLVDSTVTYFPRNFTTENIEMAAEAMDYWGTLLKTLLLSVSVGIIQMTISALVGYGLARFKFKGKGILFALVIMTIVIPPDRKSVV